MNIADRMARQLSKAGVTPGKIAVKLAVSAVSARLPDRIEKQINRAKVDAAIAATRMPPPDFVYREPRMPDAKKAADDAVKRFLEDRMYDDIPMERSKLDPSRIKTMADVRRVIISEQPREYVVSSDEQVHRGAPNFRTIGMEALEGKGYAELKRDRNDDLNERIVTTPDEPQELPFSAIKIDLSGGLGKVVGPETQPAPREAPPGEKASPAEKRPVASPGSIEMTGVQKQMLDAMRAQRKALKL